MKHALEVCWGDSKSSLESIGYQFLDRVRFENYGGLTDCWISYHGNVNPVAQQ